MGDAKLNPTVLAELNRQLNHEHNAAYAYQAMAVWCASENLRGFARFFARQAGEEREHAAKMMQHLLDRGEIPALAALEAPRQKFGSLLELAEQAQAMERANTRGIHAVYEAALGVKDYAAQVLMHWFIGEQVEEEAWAAELVSRVRSATCAGSYQDLDRHVERLIEEEKPAARS